MHWLLDVEFKDDLSRYRAGHGAKNMAVVRRFALSLVRVNKVKGSVKTRRKKQAATRTSCCKSFRLLERNLDSVPLGVIHGWEVSVNGAKELFLN